MYSLNHEGSPTWEYKKRKLREMEEQGKLKGGAGMKIPGLDTTFVRRGLPLPTFAKKSSHRSFDPGTFEDNIGGSGGHVNLYIVEVTDIATSRVL